MIKRTFTIWMVLLVMSALTVPESLASSATHADRMVRKMVTVEKYHAEMRKQRHKISQTIREQAGKHFDMSSIPNKDFQFFMDDFIEATAKEMVSGLRAAFVEYLIGGMTELDLEIAADCLEGKDCRRNSLSGLGRRTMQGLSQFGRNAGAQVGRAVGIAVTPRLIKLVQENAGQRYENPKAMIEFLRIKQANNI